MRKTRQRLFIVLVVGCCVVAVPGHTAESSKTSQEGGFESQALPVPPELRKLDVLVGNWSGTIHSDQGETDQAHSKLEASFRWILDGYCLEGVLHHTLRRRPYEARVLWSYDFVARQYRVYWITNFGSSPMAYSGRPQPGNTLVVSANTMQGTVKTIETLRLVFSQEHFQLKVTSQVPGAEVLAEDLLQADRKK